MNKATIKRFIDWLNLADHGGAVAAMRLDNALLVYRNAIKLSHISS